MTRGNEKALTEYQFPGSFSSKNLSYREIVHMFCSNRLRRAIAPNS